MKILIIQSAFIGDVVLATPVIRTLISEYPDADIDVLVRKGNEKLLDNFPGIHKVITWDKNTEKIKNLFRLIREIRKEKYDELINLQRFASTGLLTVLSNAKCTTGFSKNPFSFFFNRSIPHHIKGKLLLHETERNLNLIRHLAVTDDIRPVLYPSASDYKMVEGFKNTEYFCIAPASVWFTKQFPPEKWIVLIQSLLNNYPAPSHIYLLGSPSDSEYIEFIRKAVPDTRLINLAGKLSFLQTAALMKDARMNFVNDSAPLHFASAMNAPVTAFFCSTVPSFGFGPLSDKSVIAEINYKLYCRPCGLHGYKKCPEGHFRCAREIPPEKYTVV